MIRAALLAALVVLLGACGQKGPLRLPGTPPDAPAPAPPPPSSPSFP